MIDETRFYEEEDIIEDNYPTDLGWEMIKLSNSRKDVSDSHVSWIYETELQVFTITLLSQAITDTYGVEIEDLVSHDTEEIFAFNFKNIIIVIILIILWLYFEG